MRLDGALARIPTWVERARRLATALRKDGQLVVAPNPVPTNMFRLYLRGSSEALRDRRDQVAKERGIWVAWGFPAARVPGFVECELQLAGDSDAVAEDEALAAIKAVISAQR